MPETTTADGEPSTDLASETGRRRAVDSRFLRWGSALLALSGAGFLANGAAILYRALFSPGFEAGVESLDGQTRAELAASSHEVVHYIDHLHVNVAGLMLAVGVAVIALSWYGVRRGQRWAWATAVALPAVFLAHSVPVHQTAGFSFDALAHLGPGLLWVPALLAGAVLSYRGLRSVDGASATRRAE